MPGGTGVIRDILNTLVSKFLTTRSILCLYLMILAVQTVSLHLVEPYRYAYILFAFLANCTYGSANI